MKLLALTLAFLLLTGCGTAVARLERMEDTLEAKADALEDMAEATVAPIPSAEDLLTVEQAQDIALEHAGLTADQVTGLHTAYEIDDRVPEYDVEFFMDRTEYDYTIHARTGEILSFEVDN